MIVYDKIGVWQTHQWYQSRWFEWRLDSLVSKILPTWWWVGGMGHVPLKKVSNGGTSLCGWKSFCLRGVLLIDSQLRASVEKTSVSWNYWETSVGKSHIYYKIGDWAFYKWENSHQYYFKILDEYVVCLSQVVLLII